jgi:hypothetical protein
VQLIPCHDLVGGTAGCIDGLFTGGEEGYYNVLQDGDSAIAALHSGPLDYVFDIDSALAENVPFIIQPDEVSVGVPYTGDGRWILRNAVKHWRQRRGL